MGGDAVYASYPRMSAEQFDFGKQTEGKLLDGKCVRGKRGTFPEHICSKPACGFHGHLAEDHLDNVSLKGDVTTVGSSLTERKTVFGPAFMNPRMQRRLKREADEAASFSKSALLSERMRTYRNDKSEFNTDAHALSHRPDIIHSPPVRSPSC